MVRFHIAIRKMLIHFQAAALNKDEVMQRVRQECATKCDMLLKNDDICNKFCRFVDHIEQAHGEKLVQELEKIPRFDVLVRASDYVICVSS